MYYDKEEIYSAIIKAETIISSRSKEVDKFTRNYNDCFSFIVEYTKALHKVRTPAEDVVDSLDYSCSIDFLMQLRRRGYTLEKFATVSNYEVILNFRPQFGDIGYFEGTALIAEDGRWVTVNEKTLEIDRSRKLNFLERRLKLLARPLRIEI